MSGVRGTAPAGARTPLTPPAGRGGDARRLLLGGSAWVLAGRLAFGASAVLQSAVLARLLGPHDLGVFLLVQGLVLPAAIVGVLGLDLLAMREVRRDRGGESGGDSGGDSAENARGHVRPAPFLAAAAPLVAAVSSVVAAALAAGLWGACASPAAVLGCAAAGAVAPALWPLVALSAAQLLLAGLLRAWGRIAEATFLAGVFSTFALLCATLLAHAARADLGLRGVLALQILALACGVALSARAVLRADRVRGGDKPRLARMARVGPGLMVTQLLALLVSQSDVWVLGLAAPPEAVAQYGVAARLAQLVSLPHLVLNGVLPPLIAAHLADGRRRELEALIRASVAAATVPAVALGLAFAAFGREGLELAFGPFYGAAAGCLAILAAGNVANVACGPCSLVLILAGRQRALNRITGANCAVCLVGGAVAASWFGAVGVACVYAAALTVQGLASASACAGLVGVGTHAGPSALVHAVRSAARSGRGDPA